MPEILNPVHAERAADLAQATDKLIIVTIGVIAVMVLVTAYCAWQACRAIQEARASRYSWEDDRADADLALTVELSKPSYKRSRDWWERWCETNELPESTRRTLLAGIEEKEEKEAA